MPLHCFLKQFSKSVIVIIVISYITTFEHTRPIWPLGGVRSKNHYWSTYINNILVKGKKLKCSSLEELDWVWKVEGHWTANDRSVKSSAFQSTPTLSRSRSQLSNCSHVSITPSLLSYKPDKTNRPALLTYAGLGQAEVGR